MFSSLLFHLNSISSGTPCITDCVMAELEKLGPKFRVALRIAKDPRFERIHCQHKGTYADDCICNLVSKSPVYIVATNDRDLKRRIRKIPGVPIMYIGGYSQHKYNIERLPEAWGGLFHFFSSFKFFFFFVYIRILIIYSTTCIIALFPHSFYHRLNLRNNISFRKNV